MPSGFLIGSCSGLASALLFYSAAHGAPLLRTPLLLLTPLPSLLAGFGWGWLAAAVGALAGAVAVAIAADPAVAAGFGLALGVPTTLATYLAYRRRPQGGDPQQRQWYPPGHLIAALALYGGALPLLVLPLIGGSYAVLEGPIAEFYRGLVAQAPPELRLEALTEANITALAAFTIALLPGALAAYWLAVFTLNLYLAGRIIGASGRLGRDWPDLAAMRFPAGFAVAMVPALAAFLLPGLPRVAASSFTGGLLFAHLLAGLALIHYVARGRAPWILWLAYASLIVLGPYAALAIAIGGLLDTPLNLKSRLRGHPPAP